MNQDCFEEAHEQDSFHYLESSEVKLAQHDEEDHLESIPVAGMRHISNSASKQKNKASTGKPRVLLVDDDEFNHFALKSMLQIYDLQLDFSKSQHDALQKVTNRL